MMGKRKFAPKLYYQVSLDSLVPQDHLLRQIAEVIDFSFIYPLARPYYSHTGQPSVDPSVIFKTLLIGYLYGITSERRLMADIQVNLAYRWFLGYDLDEAIPDHSVLSKARARFGMEVFEGFFQGSIEMCGEAGLLSEGPVYVDTTLVQAGASMDSLVKRDEGIKPPLSIEEYVRRLYAENALPPQEEGSPPPPPWQGSVPDNRVPPRYRKVRPDGHRRKANSELISRTDPEATLVSRRGFGLHLAYKAHVAVAGRRGQVITAAVATTGAKADEHLLGEMLWHHRRLSGLAVREVVADAKYGTMANYAFLDQAGMTAFIPSRQRVAGPRGIWGKDRFRYLEEEDVFLCPAGIRMKRFARRPSTRRVSYRVERGACVECRFREQCTPSGGDRTISRPFDQKLVDEAKERLSSPLGQLLLRQRKVRAEGVFALAKELHGLRRTRFKGRWKVQIQIWLTAAAINIKRALRELRKGGTIAKEAQASTPKPPLNSLICFADAAREIAARTHRILVRLEDRFGNNPR
ncbi:MAG: IS1182 family transposase [Anaerolineae bacterium]